MSAPKKNKVIGVILTYNCEAMLERAFRAIPMAYFDEVICVDDGSTDQTKAVAAKLGIPFFTHEHTGYGGNLFYGFEKAMERGADYLIELHGDGQYDFNSVPLAVEKFKQGSDLVLGNRFYDFRQPFRDGMDPVRYLGNVGLSLIGRIGLALPHRDLFPGFRGYSRKFVETLNFSNNSDNYFFSFEIIAQSRYCGLKIDQVRTRCDYHGPHTSMKMSKGWSLIAHTLKTICQFWLARGLGLRFGPFAALDSSSGSGPSPDSRGVVST